MLKASQASRFRLRSAKRQRSQGLGPRRWRSGGERLFIKCRFDTDHPVESFELVTRLLDCKPTHVGPKSAGRREPIALPKPGQRGTSRGPAAPHRTIERRIDRLILSHGHYDHFGGLAGFLQQNHARLRTGLPLYVGGEECFCSREWIIGKLQDFGALDRRVLADAKVKVVFAEVPAVVSGHAFTTGHIPITSFEKVLAPTRMTVGIKDGVGCFPDRLPENKRSATVIPDDFEHEQATCFNIKDRGLVVITSCSHRGVVNVVKRAVEVSGVRKVHAVMGGFHLAPHKEEYVRETVAT
jgi:metal-dependent hydrolase (beta-lactamase superfamily II)